MFCDKVDKIIFYLNINCNKQILNTYIWPCYKLCISIYLFIYFSYFAMFKYNLLKCFSTQTEYPNHYDYFL